MWIRVVPEDDPRAQAHWLEVPRRSERFLGWEGTVALYADCVPTGHVPVSFARWRQSVW